MSGVELIAAERERQISKEGWSAAHDDTEHNGGELISAAQCYFGARRHYVRFRDGTPVEWPWDHESWNPSEDPIRNLVKAGALIAAEIDRLKREAARDMRADTGENGNG